MTSGETLKAEYNGLCILHKENTEQGGAIVLNNPMFGWYMGKSTSDACRYYFGVSDVPSSVIGSSFGLNEAGYALVLDCYANSGKDWTTYPTGTFTESADKEDNTYYDGNSYVIYFNGSEYSDPMHISGNITITHEGNTTKISTIYMDESGIDHPITFEGDLRFGNGTAMQSLPNLPQLMHDVEHKGVYASGIYMGDLFGTGGGLTIVTIDDENRENRITPYYSVDLGIIGTKWADPKNEMKLEEGTYEFATTYKKGTWMSPVELEMMGGVLPIGTYVLYDDGESSTGYYAYALDGTITVKEIANSQYRITYDLVTATGYKLTGSYEGYVTLSNASSDKEDDGSSTLTEDLEMDLSYLEKAYCYPQTQIYIGSLGYRDISEIMNFDPPAPEPCGYQFIELGLTSGTYKPHEDYNDPGKIVEGDIIRLDLLVNPGDEDKITPGTYEISPDRYPVSMWPGVCLRGFQATEHIGTRWMLIGSAIGNGKPDYYKDPDYFVIDGELNVPSMKGYASLYEGTVTIKKAESGDNYFTFEINGKDVLHHSITGTWTGPVVLGGTDTPVVSSGKDFGSISLTNAAPTTNRQEKSTRIPTARELKGLQPAPMQPIDRMTFR